MTSRETGPRGPEPSRARPRPHRLRRDAGHRRPRQLRRRPARPLRPARQPVKVYEPYQMLGEIEDDLAGAMGLDVGGVLAAQDHVRLRQRGLEALAHVRRARGAGAARCSHVTLDANGDILIYPEGDMTAPPSGRMPKGGYFFDTIVRQPPLDEDHLEPRRQPRGVQARRATRTSTYFARRDRGRGGHRTRP